MANTDKELEDLRKDLDGLKAQLKALANDGGDVLASARSKLEAEAERVRLAAQSIRRLGVVSHGRAQQLQRHERAVGEPFGLPHGARGPHTDGSAQTELTTEHGAALEGRARGVPSTAQ